jgi:MoaA/NifB/PqqE/SkfB family radical SAM enzyme
VALAISGITWILSYRCNLNCRHCFFDVDGPLRALDSEMAHKALVSLNHSEPLSWQHVSGGEPLLFEKELHSLLEVIQASGSKTIGIATNGFWGDSLQRAKQTVAQLKQRGVNGVCLSADKYHQQYIPLEHIQTAAEQVFAQGLGKHSFVVRCYLEEENPATERESFAIPLAPIPVRTIGKGSSLALEAALGHEEGLPNSPCRNLCCCLGETSPFEPQMVWIDPYGNVMICYGLIIGNLNAESLVDILENYSVRQSALLETLATQGPIGLYQLAVKTGWQPVGPFADECDLCWQARYALRGDFPEALGPDECYPDFIDTGL